ncbi:MAG: DUF2490 domain-containing protein [Saprospiraceae bacterium]|nr:DUF2490 domain-containing protein [Saprospiraceae bacterium]
MPVNTQPNGVLSLVVTVVILLICSPNFYAQTLVGGSLYAPAQDQSQSSNKIWLQYQNSFQFKKGMFIDTDFGNIFNTAVSDKRLNIRSVFKYQLTKNLRVGTGMGFFWNYDRPNLLQELRFVQEVNYFKDFGASIMFHDLRVEERIQQSFEDRDDYQTRLRYRFGLQFPTSGPVYFGLYDEVFKNLGAAGTDQPFFAMNRAGLFLGYRTYNFVSLEAHIMVEDIYSKKSGQTDRSMILQLVAKHVI